MSPLWPQEASLGSNKTKEIADAIWERITNGLIVTRLWLSGLSLNVRNNTLALQDSKCRGPGEWMIPLVCDSQREGAGYRFILAAGRYREALKTSRYICQSVCGGEGKQLKRVDSHRMHP